MNGGAALGVDLERQSPLADHHKRRRGARVDPGPGLLQLVLLLGHLHLRVVERAASRRRRGRVAVLGDPQRERVGRRRLVGRDQHLELVAGAVDRLARHARARPDASAEFCRANAGGGGARLESSAAVNTAPATRIASPLISRRSRRAAGAPSSGSRRGRRRAGASCAAG